MYVMLLPGDLQKALMGGSFHPPIKPGSRSSPSRRIAWRQGENVQHPDLNPSRASWREAFTLLSPTTTSKRRMIYCATFPSGSILL